MHASAGLVLVCVCLWWVVTLSCWAIILERCIVYIEVPIRVFCFCSRGAGVGVACSVCRVFTSTSTLLDCFFVCFSLYCSSTCICVALLFCCPRKIVVVGGLCYHNQATLLLGNQLGNQLSCLLTSVVTTLFAPGGGYSCGKRTAVLCSVQPTLVHLLVSCSNAIRSVCVSLWPLSSRRTQMYVPVQALSVLGPQRHQVPRREHHASQSAWPGHTIHAPLSYDRYDTSSRHGSCCLHNHQPTQAAFCSPCPVMYVCTAASKPYSPCRATSVSSGTAGV